jgi:hypothetical protein
LQLLPKALECAGSEATAQAFLTNAETTPVAGARQVSGASEKYMQSGEPSLKVTVTLPRCVPCGSCETMGSLMLPAW